jgi:hypothetical protein
MADIISDLLNEMGIEYKFVREFPIGDVVFGNVESQVRSGSHIAPQKTVSQFRHQMNGGAKFPPIVLCKATKEIADGNTRFQATKLNGGETIEAYVADFGTLNIRRLFAGRINQQGGLRLEASEAKALALEALEEGTEPADISLFLGVSVHEVVKWREEIEGRRRLDGVLSSAQEARLTPSHFVRMNAIKSDPILRLFALLVADAGLDTKDTSKLVSVLRKQRSEDDASHLIRTWTTEYKPQRAKVKAGLGTKKPSALACIGLAYSNLSKRSLREYTMEINGGVSDEILRQIAFINEFSEKLIEAFTTAAP